MDNIVIFRVVGAVLIIFGIVLAANPELISNKPVPNDIFKAVERRIWWGLFIGFGLLLQFHHQLVPWQATIAATLSSLLVGLLIDLRANTHFMLNFCVKGRIIKISGKQNKELQPI